MSMYGIYDPVEAFSDARKIGEDIAEAERSGDEDRDRLFELRYKQMLCGIRLNAYPCCRGGLDLYL